MTEQVQTAVTGGGPPDSTALSEEITKLAKAVSDSAEAMKESKDTDTARWHEQHQINADASARLTELQADYKDRLRDEETAKALEAAREMREFLSQARTPAKAIGATPWLRSAGYRPGSFISAIDRAGGRDAEGQGIGKAALVELAAMFDGELLPEGAAKAATYQQAWGKATLGTTDATGGWVIPNAIVDEFIRPASSRDIYTTLCTVRSGVTTAAVDIPYRTGAPARAVVAAFGATKENVDLAYAGYTATMYTLARIHDIGNQFLRQSAGAAEADVFASLAEAFALGTSYYVREGSGSSEPFGYTSALTNGPAAFRTSFTPSSTTLAGSIANAIATDAGVLSGRGHLPGDLAAVLSGTSYWTMVSQGTDNAGFFFAPAGGPEAIRPGTLMTPFGIPVYPDPAADQQGTAAVTDNLVVGNWKKFTIYHGQAYRVDRSDIAGTRWDTNVTGFRGEMEMGFDARPAVYSGNFQMNTDVVP